MIRNSLALVCALVLAGALAGCGRPDEASSPDAGLGTGTDAAAGSGGAGSARATGHAAGAGSGAVRGTVTFTGRDTDVAVPLEGDPYCAAHHGSATAMTETVVTDAERRLANVVVQVRSGPLAGPYAPPAEAGTLDQKGCHYEPHVLALQVGQPLKIRNSDATLHNIHAAAAANPSFNEGQPFPGMELQKTFTRAETAIPLRCSVHPWMLAWVAVVEHPFFAVTGADGGFEITGLEPGNYTLAAWHETLGTAVAEVTVPADGAAEVAFTFPPAAQ